MPRRLTARSPIDALEERRIRKLAGARHAPADWSERAVIIALSWSGNSCLDIAEKLGCHPRKVRRWIGRFNAEGLDGLGDRSGVGRKRRITEEERSRVIALVGQVPPGRPARGADGELHAEDESGPSVWTLNALTDAARTAGIDIHRSQVRRILLAEKIRWRQPRSWASSKDPDFAPKGPGSWSSTLSPRRKPR